MPDRPASIPMHSMLSMLMHRQHLHKTERTRNKCNIHTVQLSSKITFACVPNASCMHLACTLGASRIWQKGVRQWVKSLLLLYHEVLHLHRHILCAFRTRLAFLQPLIKNIIDINYNKIWSQQKGKIMHWKHFYSTTIGCHRSLVINSFTRNKYCWLLVHYITEQQVCTLYKIYSKHALWHRCYYRNLLNDRAINFTPNFPSFLIVVYDMLL